MKKKRTRIFTAVIAVVFLLCIHALLENRVETAGSIFIYSVYIILATTCIVFMEPQLKMIYLQVSFLRRYFEEEPLTSEPLRPNVAIAVKKAILDYTELLCSKRRAVLISPDVYNGELPIDKGFNPDSDGALQDCPEPGADGFLAITGAPGSGKSFELIKRAGTVCGKLSVLIKNGTSPLGNVKVPIFVELKTLDRVLDDEWIAKTVVKSAKIAGINLKEEQVMSLIAGYDTFFFFDGVDEVSPAFLEGTVARIIEFSKNTGVTFSCRKAVFNELQTQNILPRIDLPSELYLKPLELDWVLEIIADLEEYSGERKEGYTAAEKQEMKAVILHHKSLQDHLGRAIILNLFILTYHHLTPEEKIALASAGEKDVLNLLWEHYENIVSKTKLDCDIDILGLRTYTVWIAKNMERDSFFIESIQPHWLSVVSDNDEIRSSATLQALFFLSTRIVAALVIGIAFGCILATPLTFLSASVLGGAIIAIIAGIYKHRAPNNGPSLAKTFFPVLMMAALVIVCGVYQGASVPHMHSLMTTPWFAVAESWPGILLGIILSTIFSYRVIMEHKDNKYILPVEVFDFNWAHALRYGLSWGFVSGVLVGSIAVFVKVAKTNMAFTHGWLIPQVENIGRRFGTFPLTGMKLNTGIFLYGFTAAFIIASIIIIIMAGRFSEAEQNPEESQRLKYAIAKSFRHALKNALRVGGLSGLFYLLLTLWLGTADVVHCITFPLGMSMLAFLWFGGMEGINHIFLRINLYIRGIAPASYLPWVHAQRKMGLVIPSGYQMQFYHSTLATYYKEYPLADEYCVPRIRLKKHVRLDLIIYAVALSGFLALFFFPFIYRYVRHAYWLTPHEINVRFNASQVTRLNDSTYGILKSGKLKMEPGGFINVGTFVGWVWPEGTNHGFMGMPMDSVYNIQNPGYNLATFRHGALLYRLSADGVKWKPFRYTIENSSQRFIVIPVTKGDRLQFIVNDKECENNSGHYRLDLTFCDRCRFGPHGSDDDKRETSNCIPDEKK